MEEQEFRHLAKIFEEETGERPDMAWFERNVKPAFDEAYCPKMAENTFKYISVDLESPITEHLTAADCELAVESIIDIAMYELKIVYN